MKNTRTLYDSNTNEPLSHTDLGITPKQYAQLVFESLDADTFDGYTLTDTGRRVYAL